MAGMKDDKKIVEQYLDNRNRLVLVGEDGTEWYAPVEPVHPWRWRAMTIWIVIFSVAIIVTLHEIQDSRLSSCKHTYEGVRQIFKPFFVGAPQGDVSKFNNRIDLLKDQCGEQVGYFW